MLKKKDIFLRKKYIIKETRTVGSKESCTHDPE